MSGWKAITLAYREKAASNERIDTQQDKTDNMDILNMKEISRAAEHDLFRSVVSQPHASKLKN